jgi:hypothetical protein
VIQFDPIQHRFTLNGEAVPSVTTILKAGGWIDTTFFTEEGRRRGEIVHQATALLDQQRLDWLSIPEEYRGYVLSYEKARDLLKLGIRRIEFIVHKGKLWAGIEDREAMWERQLAVVELKTGAPALSDKLQMAGYAGTHGKPPRQLLLYLKVDGSMAKVVELQKAEREECAFRWDQVQSLHHWRQRRSRK